MKLHELSPSEGSRKNRKRVGRGPGSGMGGTATRGNKGLKQRSGGSVAPGFEGGQMPIYRRLPKRGFKNVLAKRVLIVNVSDLDCFEDKAIIDADALRQRGLIKGSFDMVKVLGNGEISKAFTLKQCLVSKTARQKIEAAGGSIDS